MAKRRKNSMVGDMISTGVGTLVGVGLTGATAAQVNALPAGSMERSIAGIIPGLQSTAIVGHNLGMVNRSFGNLGGRGPVRRRKRHSRR